jgi:hypothetical protein
MLGSVSCGKSPSIFSTPIVSRHAFELFAFEPVTSTKQISAHQNQQRNSGEATISDNSESLGTQLIFQLIDAMCSASQLAANEHKVWCTRG